MTPKERAAMQQALEALEEMFHSNSTKVAVEKYNTAYNALREALELDVLLHRIRPRGKNQIAQMWIDEIAAFKEANE